MAYGTHIRSLRWIRMDHLHSEIAYQTASRGASAAEVYMAAEIAELAHLEGMRDEEYVETTATRPLSYWASGITSEEIGWHARQRGLEGRWIVDRVEDFGNHRMPGGGPGWSGWYWFRIGDATRLGYSELDPILGDLNTQGSARYATLSFLADARTDLCAEASHPSTAVNLRLDAHRRALRQASKRSTYP